MTLHSEGAKGRALMVWGTSSSAGKSLLAKALCRWAAQRGIEVAPYKAKNMINDARVVPGPGGGWGEIGAAQYSQGLAARVQPSVDMNLVLLKPEGDTASHVVCQARSTRRCHACPGASAAATSPSRRARASFACVSATNCWSSKARARPPRSTWPPRTTST